MGASELDLKLPFKTIVIASDLSEARKPEQAILSAVEAAGFDSEAVFAIKLTFEEAITNAIKHGNRCDKSKNVTVRYFVDRQQAVILVRDEGPGFDPGAVPDPTSEERLALPSGRGLLLMRAYMDHLDYLQNGREVYLRKLSR